VRSTSLQLDYILSISRKSETISICVTRRSDSSVDATVDLEYDALALHSELGFKESTEVGFSGVWSNSRSKMV
jgi:hypothetical protein